MKIDVTWNPNWFKGVVSVGADEMDNVLDSGVEGGISTESIVKGPDCQAAVSEDSDFAGRCVVEQVPDGNAYGA